MSASGTFVEDLALVAGVAAATGLIARVAGQPAIVGYLAAGLIVGPYLPVPVFADLGRIQALAELGVVFVMFAVGLEFRVERLLRVLPRAGFTALLQIALMLGAGFQLGQAFGWDGVASAFLGAGLAISSTMVVTGVFAERAVEAEVRDHVLSVLVLQDVAAIVMIAALTALAAGQHLGPFALALTVGKLAGVLVGMLAVGVLLVPRMVRILHRRGWHEGLLVTVVGLAFGVAVLAQRLGYSVALGAFVAGLLVAESGLGHAVERAIAPLRTVFAAVFFVSIGMAVDPAAAVAGLPLALAAATVVIAGQLLSVSVATVLSGGSLRRGLLSGLALGQIGEFSFILAAIGVSAGVVPAELAPVLVTVATLTAFTTPWLLTRADRIVDRVDRLLPSRVQRVIALHPQWIASLADGDGGRARALIVALAIDGGALVTLSAVALTSGVGLVAWLGARLMLAPAIVGVSLIVFALAVATPLVLGLLRNARRLADVVASSVIGAVDLSPRLRVLRELVEAIVHLLVLLGVGVPAVALLRPLIGSSLAVAPLAIGVLLAAWWVWRRAADFEGAYHTGTRELALALLRQTGVDGSIGPMDAADGADTVEQVERATSAPPNAAPEMPGLGGSRTCAVPAAAAGDGNTLAQLDVRARTGATIVAVLRPDHGSIPPTATTTLRAGDVVALVGPSAAIDAAVALLCAPTGDHRAATVDGAA